MRFLVLFLFLALPLAADARPSNEADYEKVTGLVSIPDGAYVEGSSRFGGTQPDYKVDYSHPDIQRLIRYARRVGREENDFWGKVNRLLNYIRNRHLPNWEYDSPGYAQLNKKYLQSGEDVPLGEYSACRSGVCRENALYLHVALKEAGVPNFHAYAQVRVASRRQGFDVREDHAFVVAEHNGKRWVLDSYNEAFNGYLLDDLMGKEGITPLSQAAPVAQPVEYFRRIVKVNDFPVVWVPKAAGPPQTMRLGSPLFRSIGRSCAEFFHLVAD